jgi:hypothetical protein
MNRKECRNTRRDIDELEIGQQPGKEVAAHLAVCSSCREFRDERANLRELVASLEPVVAPADFDMRLRARIARERRGERQQPFFARFIGTPAIAAAALAVLVVGSVVWVAQRSGDSPATNVAENAPAKPPVNPDTANSVQSNETTPPVAVKPTASDRGHDLVATHGRNRLSGRGTTSRDFGVREAASIRQGEFVDAPSKPVVVSLQDERGATRKISLPPVSFGAQNLVDNRVPVSYSANSRIW